MKPLFLSTAALVCLAASSSAQAPSLAGGPKVGKDGRITPQATVAQMPVAPLVGGSDSCATPDTITGTGTFAFDNTATSSGPQAQTEAICLVYGTMGINNDVWFVWTATFSGNAEVNLCSGTSMDSRLAVYAGTGCPTPGSALACNDDYCGNISKINFLCTSGSSYVIQLGNYPGQLGATGTFTLNQYAAPAGDDCGAPIALPGPGAYNFDTAPATTSFQGQAEVSCLSFQTTQIHDDTWFSYTPTSNAVVTVTTCGLVSATSPSNDSKIAVYAGSSCPTAGSLVICNDDDLACMGGVVPFNRNSTLSFAGSCGQTYLIQVGRYANTDLSVNGQFMVTESGGTACSSPTTPYCFGDGTSTPCPCGNVGAAGNGCPSSVNANGANLATSGNSDLANDTLVLHGTGMSNSSCLYFQGTTQIAAMFGDGLRCAGGSVTRLGTKTNVAGASHYPAAGDLPVHVKGNVSVAGTRAYQVWYRNAAAFCTAATFNLSNGVLVTWQ